MTGPYVIQRTSDRRYVAFAHKTPTGSSYSKNLEHAMVFETERAAAAQACDNERVVSLWEILPTPIP